MARMTIVREKRQDWDVVRLAGIMTEEAGVQLLSLYDDCGKKVSFHFGGVTSINSNGVRAWMLFFRDFRLERVGPLTAVRRSVQHLNEWTAQTLAGLWSLLRGNAAVRESVTGPVGLVSMISDVVGDMLREAVTSARERGIMFFIAEPVRLGVARVVFFTSFISACLAIFNILPIPILDGGHLFFLLIEWLRGRPVSLKVQERSVQVSFALLMALVLMICVNDVARLIK